MTAARRQLSIIRESPTLDYLLPSENGSVLIAVLWIFVALAIIALSFSKESFVEVSAARNSQSLENSYYMARAAISATVYQMLQKNALRASQQSTDQTQDAFDAGVSSGRFGEWTYRVDIQDESGKININNIGPNSNASEEQLRALVGALGIEGQDGSIIVDSILDWIDTNSDQRMNGAEVDYYQSLNPPYKAKNGRIETLEELLLVRGVTPEYFYGFPERSADGTIIYKYGLSRCLTVYSSSSNRLINVNFAPLPVLMSINGMPPAAAKQLYERRLSKPFKSLDEIRNEIPDLGPNALANLTTGQPGRYTSIYTLTASAGAENSKVRRVLRTVISIDASQPTGYRTLYWNENVPDYIGVTQ
jgi:general secretion pathway protein K